MLIHSKEIEICSAHFSRKLVRPLFSERVQAGFPSPADRHIEVQIDLNQELIRHPLATFYIRVIGDSMVDEEISPNMLLVVDCAEQTSGCSRKNSGYALTELTEEME